MQVTNSDGTLVPAKEPHKQSPLAEGENNESALDVSGKVFDFQDLGRREDSIEGLYMYKNVFNLIPSSVGGLGRLKRLKFFANEINLFPAEFSSLVDLESLQVKVALPGLNGLPLDMLKSLKELELSKVPPRSSAFSLLNEIAVLKRLTKLSVCHFSIRYLPPEIGCLKYLEHLDLSFNKMRTLPTEITYLNALITLRVANNKLVKLPSSLSSLQILEDLDLSNNRLTSLNCLDLGSMHRLQRLNLQNNLISSLEIPSWICCDLNGNDKDTYNDELISSSVEMDVLESSAQDISDSPIMGFPSSSSNHATGSSSNNRCFAARKPRKGWKRRYYLQQRARQERLNSSRKWKGEEPATEALVQKASGKCEPCKLSERASVSLAEDSLDLLAGDSIDDKEILTGESVCGNSIVEDEFNSKDVGNCSCVALESIETRKEGENDCIEPDGDLDSLSNDTAVENKSLHLELSVNLKSKRHHSGRDLENSQPRKKRSADSHLYISSKYSTISFCSIEDYLADGFYDAGRDRPFLPLDSYEKSLPLGSREVIVMDRARDEELDAIALCAQELLFHFKKMSGLSKEKCEDSDDTLQSASLLALFVSDHFGGSDRSLTIEKTRKIVSGLNYKKPFVCTCPTGSSDSVEKSSKESLDIRDVALSDSCEKSLNSIKGRLNSIVVPIGELQFGVCRHRALLMKYLCDRMQPSIPCELVRGYLDFSPHAWNVIVVKRGDSLIRMIVDACRPLDIREETDVEYFCRYIPLSRFNLPLMGDGNPASYCSFPSFSASDQIGKTTSSSLLECKFGSVTAAAKVRSLEVSGTSAEEIRKFEFNCLGEVRILSAVKSSCIVEIYGHQISTKWASPLDGNLECRIMQSAIFLEQIKGGSLKNYVEKLARVGKKHVSVDLAMHIARDVSCALVELHSKDIIHRDIKSENILIDLDRRKADGSPVVKLCDFDRAIPLRSSLHTCCIAHIGIPPPNICVGTPRWMAPEVFRTMHDQRMYGLEVDIWSFGCLLFELLTLQVPYSGLSESNIHERILMGKRPQLTEELEALYPSEDPELEKSITEQETESESLKFLINLYRQCTVENPTERPTADILNEMLISRISSQSNSRSPAQE